MTVLKRTLLALLWLLAIGSATAWVRSQFAYDMIVRQHNEPTGGTRSETSYEIFSGDGRLTVCRTIFDDLNPGWLYPEPTKWFWTLSMPPYPLEFSWRTLGFEWEQTVGSGGRYSSVSWTLVYLTVPYFALLLALGCFPVIFLTRALRKSVRRRRGHCAMCGYDLRASRGRCPECGILPPPKLTRRARFAVSPDTKGNL